MIPAKKLWVVRVKMKSGASCSTKRPIEGTEFVAALLERAALAFLMSNGIFPASVEALEYVPEKGHEPAPAEPAVSQGARLV